MNSFIDFNEIFDDDDDDDVIINEEQDDCLKQCLTRICQADISYFLTKMNRHSDLKNKHKIFSLFLSLNRFIGAVANRRVHSNSGMKDSGK